MNTEINDQKIANERLAPKDREILRLLQMDGRLSNQELAERVGMSTSACWRRVKALEEAGVVEGYAAKINPDACGLGFHAIVHVILARHQMTHLNEFVDAIVNQDEVLDCFSTTGGADYHLRIRCADINAYNKFLDEFLFRLDGIALSLIHI